MLGHWAHGLLVLPAVADHEIVERIRFAWVASSYKVEDHETEI
jgi:hypothetical protein